MLMRTAARKVAAPRQRLAETTSFTAPIAGWISNRALAMPETGPQGAVVLENFFPTATGAVLRRGSQVYVQVTETGGVRSVFKYVVGANRKLFAATDDTIYDITTIVNPVNLQIGSPGLYEIGEVGGDYIIGDFALQPSQTAWEDASGGDWFTVQFSVTGGVFLIGVNGSSTGFIYDGAAFYPNVPGGVWTVSYDAEVTPFTVGGIVTGGTSGATGTVLEILPGGALILTGDAGSFENDETLTGSLGGAATAASDAVNLVPGVTFPDGLTTADMAFVWVYKNTLWFVQKGSLSAWYLPVDSIGGDAEEFPLGAEFGQGGSLMVGQAWSLNASGQGGLSEQNVFVSTEGEAVVYQGSHPSVTADWSKVGTYRLGAPMGRRGFIRAGGDLIFATTIGFVALSTAIQVDLAALAPKAVSYAIEDAWNRAVGVRGREDWVCCLWPESQMVAIAPPTGEQSPMFLVSNARTGAWAPFTNWNATCMEVFEGQLYFGTPDGYVMAAMVGGTDNGIPFTGAYMPLFTDVGKPSIRKAARQARTELISASEISEKLSCRFDFDDSLPSPPDVEPIPVGNEWDNAIWGESLWSSERATIVSKRRHSVSGYGYRIAPVLQITSGAAVPLDVQIVSLDVDFESGGSFT
jgi:hypothetical protein